MIDGYRLSQALHVAAMLGLADLLAEGPRTFEQLAGATGSDADALRRLLRALATAGVLEEQGGAYALTSLGDGLRGDVPGSLRDWARMIGRPYQWNAWSELSHSVRTGETAFDSAYGESVWQYRADHPDESAFFDAAMTSLTRMVDAAVVAGYGFGRFEHVVDVGGGNGTFIATLLRAHPALRGTLFDQEHVVAGAPPVERCQVVAGSFFDRVPRGGDAYVLKSVIHDWDDEAAVAILRTVAAALDRDACVLLVEHDLAEPAAAWLDLQMLVMTGGRERSEMEYARLFDLAGLRYVGAVPAGAGFAVFEARLPAPTTAAAHRAP